MRHAGSPHWGQAEGLGSVMASWVRRFLPRVLDCLLLGTAIFNLCHDDVEKYNAIFRPPPGKRGVVRGGVKFFIFPAGASRRPKSMAAGTIIQAP